jgi:mycofactocin precursor
MATHAGTEPRQGGPAAHRAPGGAAEAALARGVLPPAPHSGSGLSGDVPGSSAAAAGEAAGDLVLDDLLVEEVSIDGMCGVY